MSPDFPELTVFGCCSQIEFGLSWVGPGVGLTDPCGLLPTLDVLWLQWEILLLSTEGKGPEKYWISTLREVQKRDCILFWRSRSNRSSACFQVGMNRMTYQDPFQPKLFNDTLTSRQFCWQAANCWLQNIMHNIKQAVRRQDFNAHTYIMSWSDPIN